MVVPPVPSVPANNAPGKDITPEAKPEKAFSGIEPQEAQVQSPRCLDCNKPLSEHPFVAGQGMKCPEVDKKADIAPPVVSVNPVESPVTSAPEADKPARSRRGRRPKNSVVMGVEPEVVNSASAPAPAPSAAIPAPLPISVPVVGPDPVQTVVPAQVSPAVPPQVNPAPPAQPVDFPGKPTTEQMADYRKRVSVYTSELPSSENMGSVQKMRAFITKMSGTAPQFMTTDQWEEQLAWFQSFVEKNGLKGLVKYINDILGVK